MSNTWFTSDQHYFHKNVIKYCDRPFYAGMFDQFRRKLGGDVTEKAVAVMNEELIRRHNAVVQPGDKVYHLGDFSLWKSAPKLILPRLNGEHHLIPGNHDWCHPVHGKKKVQQYIDAYKAAGFVSVELEATMLLLGTPVTLHHMPFSGHHDDRYAALRPKDFGQVLLHGHVHNNWKVKGRMINVGVDVWGYAPVSMNEILDLIRAM